uniref:Uncharacterized protein n=1 Tax=Plectus sambesii TaxID=2011161 RepID=A0A914X6U5_9BILA
GRLEADKDEKPEVDSDDDNSVFHLDDSLNSNRSTLV